MARPVIIEDNDD
jgi:DNA mismatch repair protein MSH6